MTTRLLASWLLTMITLGAAPPAAAEDGEAPAYYDLAFTIEQRGEVLGNPRLLVEPGDTAEIRVEPDSGEGGYRLQVVAAPAAGVDGAAAVNVKFERFSHGGWYPALEATARAPAGEAVSLTGAADAAERLPGLAVRVTANPLSRADFARLRKDWRSRYTD